MRAFRRRGYPFPAVFEICASCEESSKDWTAEVDAGVIVCPRCGNGSPFVFLPLHVLIGASGSGKTTIIRHLAGRALPFVTLDQDILRSSPFDTAEDGYRAFRETWLRFTANIHQSRNPVLLVGSGTPDQYASPRGRCRPHVVNAYYHPTRNEIVFPAGILQPPMFDAEVDRWRLW